MNKSMMKEEVTKHLTENIIPFWKALRDDTYGGYYGYTVSYTHLTLPTIA